MAYGILKAEFEAKLRDVEQAFHRERQKYSAAQFEKKQLSQQLRRAQLDAASLDKRLREIQKCAACTCVENRRGQPFHVTSPPKLTRALSRSHEDLSDPQARDLVDDFRQKLVQSEERVKKLEVIIGERNHTITEQNQVIRTLQIDLSASEAERGRLLTVLNDEGRDRIEIATLRADRDRLEKLVGSLEEALIDARLDSPRLVVPATPTFEMKEWRQRVGEIEAELSVHKSHIAAQDTTLTRVKTELLAERRQNEFLLHTLKEAEKKKSEVEAEKSRLIAALESQKESRADEQQQRELRESLERHTLISLEKYKKKYHESVTKCERMEQRVAFLEADLVRERNFNDSIRNDLDLIEREEQLVCLENANAQMNIEMCNMRDELGNMHAALQAADFDCAQLRQYVTEFENEIVHSRETVRTTMETEQDLHTTVATLNRELRSARNKNLMYQVQLEAQGRDLVETKRKLKEATNEESTSTESSPTAKQ